MIDMLNRSDVVSMIITIGADGSNMSVLCNAEANSQGRFVGLSWGFDRCVNDNNEWTPEAYCPGTGGIWNGHYCAYSCSVDCPASHPSNISRYGHD